MFDFDSLREIFSTIRKNKLRTLLTGLSIAWGIFMLIILLGAGNGLKNGVSSNFSSRAKNSISLWPGWSSVPYKGLPTNKEIKFDVKDYDLIRNKLPQVEYVSARVTKEATLTYEKEYGTWQLDGIFPDAAYINNIKIESGNGRFINKLDLDNKRKVVVISPEMKQILFKDKDPLGKYLTADNLTFQVIGVYKDEGARNNPLAYIPFTTAQTLYNKGYGFRQIDFTVKGLDTEEKNEKFIELLREKIGVLHGFDPTDKSALYIRNTAENSLQTQKIFSGINIFIWVIGIASLMAGIVGVGNIMLITVKERTKEIGIRKALGASPISILKLIIFESIMITATFGYLGMMAGIGLTEFVNNLMENSETPDKTTIFMNPTVDIWIVLGATGILVFAGVFAGLIPASKAVKVSPIEAMRAD